MSRFPLLKPSLNDLKPETIDKARMIKASHIARSKGFRKAQEYLDEQGIPYDIDTDLSTTEALVLTGEDGVKIAARGTKPTDPVDLSYDAMVPTGHEELHPLQHDAKALMEKVVNKYGVPEEVITYSYSSSKYMPLADQYGVPKTTNFNPYMGKNVLTAKPTSTEHNIFRTTEDFASIGTALVNKPNWKVESIHPHQDKLNPIEAHKYENFSEDSARRPGYTEELMMQTYRQGQKSGELGMTHDMLVAQEEGKTFTEYNVENNPGDTTGGKLSGNRMTRDSRWAKRWAELKGTGTSAPAFTSEEEAFFDSLPTQPQETPNPRLDPNKPALRPKQVQEFAFKSAPERVAHIEAEHAKLADLMEVTDTHTAPYKSSASEFARAFHPTNLGASLGTAYVAHELINAVDKDHNIEEHVRTGLEGGVAGGSGALAAAALAGSAVSAPVAAVGTVSGGASYLAGSETTKLVTKGMKVLTHNQDASEATGAAVGGAVGGAVGAGTAIGGAALLGAEIGEFGGPVAAAVGAGVGTVIGIGSWLIGKIH